MPSISKLHGLADTTDSLADTTDSVAFMTEGAFGAFGGPAIVGAVSMSTTALFLTEAGDATAISVNDLHQGQIGDCFLISSIGELAMTKPADITNMIKVNADGTETVTLHTAANGRLPGFGTTAFKAVSVTVSNVFPTYSVNNAAGQDVVGGQKEIWAQVLEKAVATLDGGYGAISHGGNPVIAMEELTGKAATTMNPASVSAATLAALSKAGAMIVFDTGAGSTAYNLVGSHAYMFDKMTMVNNVATVQLKNPWGFDQPAAIPVSQLSKVFVEIDVGKAA